MIDPSYLNAYIDRLKAHDWHYEQSDDPRVFKAGQAARFALEREAQLDTSGVLQALYGSCRSACTGYDRGITCAVTFDEYVDLVLKRNKASAPGRPDPTRRLAACVRSLAHALARADPDNGAPQRAMKLLQDLQLLESTLLPAKPHVDP